MSARFRRHLTRTAVLLFLLMALGSLAAPKVHATHEGTTHAELAWDKCIVQDDNDKARLQIERVSPCLNPDIKDFPWIVNVWQWALSIVNVFAAFVLIFMAFANILYPWQTLEPFRIRQLLPTFIWGVILANASLFICRIVVTAADILMSDSGIKVDLATLYQNWGFEPGLLKIGIIPAMFGKAIAVDIGQLLFQLVTATIFIYLPLLGMIFLSFLFYFRFAIIFILSAVSPLAFGSIIFPATRGFLNRWWDMFWKWTFGGVASYLLLYLASLVSPKLTAAGAVAGGGLDTIKLIPYILSLGLVYMAIMAPFKLGGALGSMIQGLGKNLSRRAWGLGVGATKFAASKGYHYTKLGAARGVAGAEKAAKLTQEGTPAHLAAQARVRRAKSWHQFVSSPAIIRGGFEARKAAEEKTLKRAMAGSGLYETVAGRAAAIAARKEDFASIAQNPELGYQVGILQKIKGKHPRVDGAWLKEFARSTPVEQEEMSRAMGLSVEEHLKVREAYTGAIRNSRYGTSMLDPAELFNAGLNADSPEAGKQAMITYQFQQREAARQRAREARQQGGPAPAAGGRPASVAVATAAEAQFGISRDRASSIESAALGLQGFGHAITPQELATMASAHTTAGTLDLPRFKEALLKDVVTKGGSVDAADAARIADKIGRDAARLSTQHVNVDRGMAIESRWTLKQTENANDPRQVVDTLRQNASKYEQTIEAMADQLPDAKLNADHKALLKVHEDINITDDTDYDQVRHRLQEKLAGARGLLEGQIEQTEQAAVAELEARLESNPTEVRVNMGKAFHMIFAGKIESDPPLLDMKDFGLSMDKTMDKLGETHGEYLRKGLTKFKTRLARDRLAVSKEANATARREKEKLVTDLTEGMKALERLQKAADERGSGSADTLARAVRSMAEKQVPEAPAAPENAPIQDTGPPDVDLA